MRNYEVLLDFYNEAQHLGHNVEGQLRSEVEHSLPELQRHYPGLRKVVVTLEQPAQRELSHLYQGQVTVYDEGGKIYATARQANPVDALKEALEAVENDIQQPIARLSP